MQNASYRIAGLLLEIVFPEVLKREEILPSFEPFWVERTVGEKITCSIELSLDESPTREDMGKLLSDVSVVWGERFCFYEQGDQYITTIRSEAVESLWKMRSNKDFSRSVIYMIRKEPSICDILSWLTMVAFGQACLGDRAILLHASVIAHEGKGLAFLGKSGTGKSTHSRLWLDHVKDTELVNDDNPAIRLEKNGQVYIYGTPWSGKTPCYKNIKVPLQALVRLKQAEHNSMKRKEGVAGLVCVLPSCTAIRWNKRLFSEMTNTVEAIIQKILVVELECLPNPQAALLCSSEVVRLTRKHKVIEK